MIKASIDLGTNTCLLLIADWDQSSQKIQSPIGDYATIVRLGEGVDKNRELQPAAMDRTLQCLKKYSSTVIESGGNLSEAICVATSQARDAKNCHDFFARVEKETGFKFRVISGEEEARLTFVGALLPGMDPINSCVIDIGGGSTELITLNHSQSIDIGSVRFTERFLKSDPVTDDEFWECQDRIDQGLESLKPLRSQIPISAQLVGVAGTVTTLAAWYLNLSSFDPQKVDGTLLTRGDIHRMVEELKWRTVSERKKLSGMEPQRADVILAGALILWRSMELLNFSELRVSTRGLRYGALTLSTV